MISYKFNKEKRIVETNIRGTTTVKDLTDYILSLSKDTGLPKILKILTDARDGKFSSETEPEDLEEIAEANYKSLAARDFIYDAFIISSPIEKAMGQLYRELSKAKNYLFNIFATKESAEKWLDQF